MYSHRFSTGFNSGEYGGKKNNSILLGTTSSLDRCQPAPSNTGAVENLVYEKIRDKHDKQ